MFSGGSKLWWQARSWNSIESQLASRATRAQSHREAQVTRAETGANLCAVATGGLAVAVLLQFVRAEFFAGVGAPVLITSAIIWLSGVGVFWWTNQRFRGHWSAFLRHQLFAIPVVLLNIAVIAAICALAFAYFAATQGPPACFLLVVLTAPFVVWKLKPFAQLSRRARAEIEAILPPQDEQNDA